MASLITWLMLVLGMAVLTGLAWFFWVISYSAFDVHWILGVPTRIAAFAFTLAAAGSALGVILVPIMKE